jgi:hypothetical protein
MKGSTGAGPNSEYTSTHWCAFHNPDIMLTFEEPEAFTDYKMYVQGGCGNSPQEWKILASDDKDAATDSWVEVAHESTVLETQRLQFDATKHESHSACVSGKANGLWGDDKKTSVTISSVTIPLETSKCQAKWTSLWARSRDNEVDRFYVKVQSPGANSASWVQKWSKHQAGGGNLDVSINFDCPAGSDVMMKFTSDINQNHADEAWGFCNVELRDAGTNTAIATDTVTDTDCWKGGRSWTNEANAFEIKGRMAPASIFFTHMIGDRTGVLHIGTNQEMDLTRPSIDLPFSTWVYDGAVLELAPVTVIHGVYMQVSGRIGNIKNLTIHHGGELWGNAGGRTKGALNGSTYEFDRLMLQDRSKFHMEADPVVDDHYTLNTDYTSVEGGALLRATKVVFNTIDLRIDDGGKVEGDANGYHHRHGYEGFGKHGPINHGAGTHDPTGKGGGSGGGHAGPAVTEARRRLQRVPRMEMCTSPSSSAAPVVSSRPVI